MSLKKLRKTNLIKYRNTGVRNTFKYMVEQEESTMRNEPLMPTDEIIIVADTPARKQEDVKVTIEAPVDLLGKDKRSAKKAKKTARKPAKKALKKPKKAKPAKKAQKKPKKAVKKVKRPTKKVAKKTVKRPVKSAPKKPTAKKSGFGKIFQRFKRK